MTRRFPNFTRGSICLVLFLSILCSCSNRSSIAIRATVETFYSAVQNDNGPLLDDNLSPSAPPAFRSHVQRTASEAQADPQTKASVQLVRVEEPSINGDTARVPVVFADGGRDIVVLNREGLRWKVASSSRLG
jgi:hypothetical protein